MQATTDPKVAKVKAKHLHSSGPHPKAAIGGIAVTGAVMEVAHGTEAAVGGIADKCRYLSRTEKSDAKFFVCSAQFSWCLTVLLNFLRCVIKGPN